MNNTSSFYRILSNSDSPYYLIQHVVNNVPSVLMDDFGNHKRFCGLSQAQEYLVSIGVHEAELSVETAYDEMIGSPSDSDNSHYTMDTHF